MKFLEILDTLINNVGNMANDEFLNFKTEHVGSR